MKMRFVTAALAFAVAAVATWSMADSAVWVKAGILSEEEAAEGFVPLFNGINLAGWWIRGENQAAFRADDGVLVVTGEKGGDYMFTHKQYGDFVLRYEYRCVSGEGNSGVGIRCPEEGNPAHAGMEIQVLRPGWETPYQRTGSLYATVAAPEGADNPFGEWNSVEILCDGPRIRTTLNGTVLYDVKTTDYTEDALTEEWQKPLTDRPKVGYIGLQDHSDEVWFRNMRIKELNTGDKDSE